YVISTTFLITITDSNGVRYFARSIKAQSELERNKSLQKMEIERRYWEAKGIDWGIVTQKDIPIVMARNIEWVHSSLFDYKERGFSDKDIQFMSNTLIDMIVRKTTTVREIISDFDRVYNYGAGTGLYVFKYLVATKRIEVDMTKEININNLVISYKEKGTSKEGGGIVAIS
ncbi:TnsA endonuclease, partial [Clostridium tetanomorphum DSM 665]